MENLISLSLLNDFIFCPYSIYLHNVYKSSEEDLYHSYYQVRGKNNHISIDEKKYTTRKDILMALDVYSEEYGIQGKIDIYNSTKKSLVERKYKVERIFQGQIYQLYGQYFCMKEHGYEIEKMGIYSMADNKFHEIIKPDEMEISRFKMFLEEFRNYDIRKEINININKCNMCIYKNLCDKIDR